MHYKKILALIPLCLVIGFFSCSKGEKKVEAPKQEQITRNLVPPKSELKGQNFFVSSATLRSLQWWTQLLKRSSRHQA